MPNDPLFQGVLTSTSTSGMADFVVSRVADHACRCDECVALDEVDIPMLALCKCYLKNEIDYEHFRLQHVQLVSELTPRQAVIHKHFSTGALGLADTVEGLMFPGLDESDGIGEMTYMGKPLGDREFRLALRCLVLGYENRMRTVHQWKKV